MTNSHALPRPAAGAVDPAAQKASVRAPFSLEQVQRLNEYQLHVGDGFPMHPFTCPNRDVGVTYPPPGYRPDLRKATHGREGGDLGILIATEAGWVCPHCSYTQDWAHAFMAAPPTPLAEIFPGHGRAQAELLRSGINGWLTVDSFIAAYRPLAAAGKPGAQIMVDCLLRRKAELEEQGRAAHG